MKIAFYILLISFSAFAYNAKAASFEGFKQQAQCRTLGKGAAMSAVSRHTGEKVVSASLNKRSNPPTYRVKTISKSGRVRTYRVNACTGQFLG